MQQRVAETYVLVLIFSNESTILIFNLTWRVKWRKVVAMVEFHQESS